MTQTSDKLLMPSNKKTTQLYEKLVYSPLSHHEYNQAIVALKKEVDAQWLLAMKWRDRAIINKESISND